MNYNNNLQTNNTTLQSILTTAQTLPDKSNIGTTVQKWTCTLKDGNTVEKYVEVPKKYYVDIQMNDVSQGGGALDDDWAYHGETYVFEPYAPDNYKVLYSTIYVAMKNQGIYQDITTEAYNKDTRTVTIPYVTGDIDIFYDISDAWDDDFG